MNREGNTKLLQTIREIKSINILSNMARNYVSCDIVTQR